MLHRRRMRFFKTENQIRLCPEPSRVTRKSEVIECIKGRCLPVNVITSRDCGCR